jgi:ribosomal-protein-alanine N-acetyltransferase
LILSPARLPDLPDLLAIESASFDQPWPKAAFLSELKKSSPGFYVARAAPDGPVLGYLCFLQIAGEIQLLNLAVHPDHRRRGVGRALMDFLLDRAREKRGTKVFLEVRPSNQAALALYESMGFRRLYRRPGYYTPEGEDALVLEWSEEKEK